MLPSNARRRGKAANGFLESLIDPIDWLSETTFSILIFLTFTLAYWMIGFSGVPKETITPAEVNELLIGALGAVVAWGLIDGIMYALFAVFERGERHRLLDDVQAARTNDEALEIIADDMDYLLEPIVGEEDRQALYGNILVQLQKSTPRKVGLKREDLTVALAHVLVAILAVIPSTIPFVVLRDNVALALRISIILSFVMLFIAGFRWGSYTGASPWKTGLLLMSVAVALVVVALLLGG
jgi:hypothetical protein